MRELAAKALHAAMAEDWDTVKRAFAELSTDGRAITFALMAWCDTALAAQAEIRGMPQPGAEPMGEFVRPVWIDPGNGKVISNADEIPAAHRWAGRVLAARAAMDEVQFRVLVGTMPGDGFERGQYALALLMNAAKTAGAQAGGAS